MTLQNVAVDVALTAAHEPRYAGHQFVGELGGLALAVTFDDAVASMLVEQPQRDLVERGLHRPIWVRTSIQ